MKTQRGYFAKLKKVLFNPQDFFKDVAQEKSIVPSFKFVCFTSLIIGALIIVIISIINKVSSLFLGGSILFIPWMFQFIFSAVILIILFSFAFSAIIHIFAKLFKGKGTYTESYKSFSYSLAPLIPGMIIMWIPFIGSITVLVWRLIILMNGISRFHKISQTKAFLAWLLGIVSIFAFFGIVIGLLFFLMELMF